MQPQFGPTDEDLQAVQMAESYIDTAPDPAQFSMQAPAIPEEKLTAIDGIMASGVSADIDRVKHDYPTEYKAWQESNTKKMGAIKNILESDDPVAVEKLKTEYPTQYKLYQQQNNKSLMQKAASAAGVVRDYVAGAVKGKHEGYPELSALDYDKKDLFYANAEQQAKILRDSANPEGLFGPVAKATVPPAFATAQPTKDKFGNDMIVFSEDYGNIKAGTPVYANKPGASFNDLVEFKNTAAEVVVGAATGGRSLLSRMLFAGAAGTTVSATRQVRTESTAPTDQPTFNKAVGIATTAGLEGVASAAFEPVGSAIAHGTRSLARGVVKGFNKALGKAGIPPERFVDAKVLEDAINQGVPPEEAFTQVITPEGRQFLKSQGITEKELIPQVIRELIDLSKNPEADGLEPTFRIALSRAFKQSATLGELVGKADPAQQALLQAEDTLVSLSGPLGQQARERFSSDLNRLQDVVADIIGLDPRPSKAVYSEIYPNASALSQRVKDFAQAPYKEIDDLVAAGHGTQPVDTRTISEQLVELRKNYHDLYDKELDVIENTLFRYGAIDSPDKLDALKATKYAAINANLDASKARIEAATDIKALQSAVTDYNKQLSVELSSVERDIKELVSQRKDIRKQAFKGDEQLRKAQRKGATLQVLTTLKDDIEAERAAFKDFRVKESKIAKVETKKAKGRKKAEIGKVSVTKQQQFEVLKKAKIRQLEEIAAIRRTQADKILDAKFGQGKDYATLTIEAATRLYKALNGLDLDRKLNPAIHKMKKALVDDVDLLNSNDPVVGKFKEATARYKEFSDAFNSSTNAKYEQVATLLGTLSKGGNYTIEGVTYSIPAMSSSHVLPTIKSFDASQMKYFNDSLNRYKKLGPTENALAVKVQKSVRQVVWADMWDQLLTKGDNLNSITVESFETALKGLSGTSSLPDALAKVDSIFTQDQAKTIKTLHQLLDGRRRLPVGRQLKQDKEVGVFKHLFDQASNSIWLATKTPGMAAGVTTARFGRKVVEEKTERALYSNILNPYDEITKRLNLSLKDPLKYRALIEASGRTSKDISDEITIGMGRQGVPYRKLSNVDKAAFHETYKHTYPHLYQYNIRQLKEKTAIRAAGASLNNIGARDDSE